MLEWDVRGKESDEGRLSVESKGIIVQVNRVQVRERKKRGKQRG